jgi:phage shock protein PspC (stress-responsive transcriptional regulator)
MGSTAGAPCDRRVAAAPPPGSTTCETAVTTSPTNPTPAGPQTPPGTPGPSAGHELPTGTRPPLRRRPEGRLLGGVATGIADHLDVDVVIVRIVFVVLTIVTNGLGVIAYVLGWIFIPEADPREAPTAPTPRRAAAAEGGRDAVFWIGVGLLVVGVLALFGGPLSSGGWLGGPFGRDLIWPVVLIAFGFALWRAGDRPAATPASPPSPSPVVAPSTPASPPTSTTTPGATPAIPSTTPAAAGLAPTTEPIMTTDTSISPDAHPEAGTSPDAHPEAGTSPDAHPEAGPPAPVDVGAERSPTRPLDAGVGMGAAGAVPPPPPPAPPTEPAGSGPSWTPPPAPKREGSLLTRLTIGLSLVTAGVLWLLHAADVIVLGPGQVLAAALLVLGLGLVVGAFVGRGRWLILPGMLLLPIVLFTVVAFPSGWQSWDVGDGQAVGERDESPETLDQLQDAYQLGAGELTLDLTGLGPELARAGETTVRVQVGAGQIRMELPDDVELEVTGRVGAGKVDVLGVTGEGLGVNRSASREPDDARGRLIVDAQVGFGEIHVPDPAPFGTGS